MHESQESVCYRAVARIRIATSGDQTARAGRCAVARDSRSGDTRRSRLVRGCDVAVSESGQIHLAYYIDEHSRYASRFETGPWVFSTLGAAMPFGDMEALDVEVDPLGFAHVVYVDGDTSIARNLMHARSGGK